MNYCDLFFISFVVYTNVNVLKVMEHSAMFALSYSKELSIVRPHYLLSQLNSTKNIFLKTKIRSGSILTLLEELPDIS